MFIRIIQIELKKLNAPKKSNFILPKKDIGSRQNNREKRSHARDVGLVRRQGCMSSKQETNKHTHRNRHTHTHDTFQSLSGMWRKILVAIPLHLK